MHIGNTSGSFLLYRAAVCGVYVVCRSAGTDTFVLLNAGSRGYQADGCVHNHMRGAAEKIPQYKIGGFGACVAEFFNEYAAD